MKFKFISAAAYAILAASAANWDALVASAAEAGIADAASLDAASLLQRITEADPHSDQSAQVQQLTETISQRDAEIARLNAENIRLNALPGATPAMPKAETDPVPVDPDKPEHAALTGKETFLEAIEKLKDW